MWCASSSSSPRRPTDQVIRGGPSSLLWRISCLVLCCRGGALYLMSGRSTNKYIYKSIPHNIIEARDNRLAGRPSKGSFNKNQHVRCPPCWSDIVSSVHQYHARDKRRRSWCLLLGYNVCMILYYEEDHHLEKVTRGISPVILLLALTFWSPQEVLMVVSRILLLGWKVL